MSSLTNTNNTRATRVWFNSRMMYIGLEDGRELGVPLDWFPNLQRASSRQRNHWRFIDDGIGIHWEDLDEDISVKALLS